MVSKILDKSIYFSYLALAILTPLIFTTTTTEIYEVPKMFFVYWISLIILFATIYKLLINRKLILPTSWPLYALLFLTATQVVSTITSTDLYLSLFGYPTRLNGGLLSTFSYLIIFAGALINLSTEKVKTMILAIIFTSLAVALWGIPSHFGWDPSCLVLTGNISSSCWSKDFDPSLRIFSTLGQPNWLASYLVLTLPIAFIFALTTKGPKQLIFALSSIAIYWAIILTNSRAGLIGLAIALILSAVFIGIKNIKSNTKTFTALLISYALITFIFADFIAQRLPEAPTQISQETLEQSPPQNVTQQSLGTESGKIRLIVWQGALSVWKNWPILGPGPETFVNTYYSFRPNSHNQTSEWEYFYNKVHNEFLNYLATTGLLGLSGYIFFLATLIYSFLRVNKKNYKHANFNKAAAAGIFGYLLTIFFGFSTVATQTTFILMSTSALVLNSDSKVKEFNLNHLKNPLNLWTKLVFVTLLFIFSAVTLARTYMANVLEKNAERTSGSRALLRYTNAITTTQFSNPYLLADFAYETSLYAQTVEDPTNLEKVIKEAKLAAQKAQKISPDNFLVTQKAAKAYLILTEVADTKDEAEQIAEKLTTLAPNYPPAYLLKSQVYTALGEKQAALDAVNKTLELKPEYLDAQKLRDQLTIAE